MEKERKKKGKKTMRKPSFLAGRLMLRPRWLGEERACEDGPGDTVILTAGPPDTGRRRERK